MPAGWVPPYSTRAGRYDDSTAPAASVDLPVPSGPRRATSGPRALVAVSTLADRRAMVLPVRRRAVVHARPDRSNSHRSGAELSRSAHRPSSDRVGQHRPRAWSTVIEVGPEGAPVSGEPEEGLELMDVTVAELVAVEHAVQEQGRQLVGRGQATPVALHRGGGQAS